MPPTTPHLANEKALGALSSRYVDVAAIPWEPTGFPGVWMKVLMEDKEKGLLTGLFRFEPGASLPDHEHVELEQSFVIEGSVQDHEGKATAGNYVWRPGGNRHTAYSPDGAVALSFLLKPNHFFGDEESEAQGASA